ncbi:MAG: HmuY family protein [Spirochaetaceae bacterium]|jgi:hypothetical protein|nr:HmuY family protein [Spirochaetaceae bacterium]
MKLNFNCLPAIFCFAALLGGCGDLKDYSETYDELPPAEVADGTVDYSLSTGQQITEPGDIASDAWDIALMRSTNIWRMIQTNSGDTAADLGSGGSGGVWYTEKFDLGDVEIDDKVDPAEGILAPYTTDQKKTVDVMGDLRVLNLNVMTFVGYANENEADGSPAQPFSGTPEHEMPYLYNKKQFYRSPGGMPPGFVATYRVYIIRHGDGIHYSKVQIYYKAGTGTDEYLVQYLNF